MHTELDSAFIKDAPENVKDATDIKQRIRLGSPAKKREIKQGNGLKKIHFLLSCTC